MYLQAEVLAKIQDVLTFAKSNPTVFKQNIHKALAEQSDGSKAVMKEELEKAQKRTAEIDKYIQGLFEAKVRGEIDGCSLTRKIQKIDIQNTKKSTLCKKSLLTLKSRGFY